MILMNLNRDAENSCVKFTYLDNQGDCKTVQINYTKDFILGHCTFVATEEFVDALIELVKDLQNGHVAQ
jgi:phage terminase large subunit